MTQGQWLSVLARIAPGEPLDLDMSKDGAGGALPAWEPGMPPPSPRLWERAELDISYIGIRVDRPVANQGHVALKLAAAALERGVTPVILTSLDSSGFERFGFRVERFVGASAADRAAWEAEMSAFWSFALIIDAADVTALG